MNIKNNLLDWKEEFKLKFNEVLQRMYNLEIIPDIQSRINERIPKAGGFMVFESQELEDFISSLLSSREKEIKEKELKEIQSIYLKFGDNPKIALSCIAVYIDISLNAKGPHSIDVNGNCNHGCC